MGGGVPYLTDSNAFEGALANAGSKLLAVDFTATWCGPCKMIGPRFEAMRPEFPFVDFAKVDVDDNQEVAASQRISAMPTFKFYRHGKQVAEFTGADENRLRALLAEHGGPPTAISSGGVVVLFGLKARPDCNGRRGTVRSFDVAKGRYAVALEATADAEEETLALKRDNLVLTCKVALAASDQAALPDTLPAGVDEGLISGYVAEKHCYLVRPFLPSGERGAEVELPAACCRLPDGCTAVVVGLQSAPEHNGKGAHVVNFDAGAGRYLVALTATSQLRLRLGNLRT